MKPFVRALLIFVALSAGAAAEPLLGQGAVETISNDLAASAETNLGLKMFSCEHVAEPDVRKACDAFNLADLEYGIFNLRHTRSVLLWQDLTSKVIFMVVLLIVAVGLYFSWKQFSISLRGGKEDPASTIELGTAGLKLTSPVLGVIILTLSLGFFYLYLVHVYPITNIR